jgi:hypothetical protein
MKIEAETRKNGGKITAHDGEIHHRKCGCGKKTPFDPLTRSEVKHFSVYIYYLCVKVLVFCFIVFRFLQFSTFFVPSHFSSSSTIDLN